MIFELMRWWYGPGWLMAANRIKTRTVNVANSFSAGILLKTLFSPWRRIVTSGAKGIDAKMQAAVDNLVSRVVGFTSRLIVLIAAGFMTAGTFVLSVLIAIAWPLIPIFGVYLIITGVV